jgi:rhodanese-related sulfurtransferase
VKRSAGWHSKALHSASICSISILLTAQLKSRLKEKNVDVRTPVEYKGNHIAPFKNIPLHTIIKKADTLNKDREEFVVV